MKNKLFIRLGAYISITLMTLYFLVGVIGPFLGFQSTTANAEFWSIVGIALLLLALILTLLILKIKQ